MVSSNTLIVLGIGLLSFGISLWQLSVPEMQSLYNSGVYFSASFKFVSGVLPYRDFAFVQPPGIILAMSPVALLSRLIGTHDGFIIARIISGVVCAANASMLAALVRHRGRIAMVIAGTSLALLPAAFFVTSGVMLEPYCILFVLAGALVIFRGEVGTGPSSRRSFFAGLLFGAAVLFKLWALLPFLAMILCLFPRGRAKAGAFLGGTSLCFGVLSLPFLIAAPRNFISQVAFAQLFRGANSSNDLSILTRLYNLTGFEPTRLLSSTTDAVVIFALFAVLVCMAFWRRRTDEHVDVFLLLSAVLSVVALLVAREFYSYYVYFAAPFLLGLLAVSLPRVARPLWTRAQNMKIRRSVRQLVQVIAGASAALLLAGLVLWVTTQYTTFNWAYGTYLPWVGVESKIVPPGSCVIYSDASYGVLTNRLTSTGPCPNVVDPDGMWLAARDPWGKPTAAFSNQWRRYFEKAEYAVFLYPHVSRVPWNASLTSWFDAHYHLVYGRHYTWIYENNVLKSG
jgi:hypothetical protein